MLEKQRDDGLWPAAGQFLKQARPEIESDGVVSMWVLQSLPNLNSDNKEATIEAAAERAFAAIKERSIDDAVTTEWMAWRALAAQRFNESSAPFVQRLLSLQHADGSWSWLARNDVGDAYATGTVLFVLNRLVQQGDASVLNEAVAAAIQRAEDHLLNSQTSNGAWTTPSRLISANESERRDYVYDFWGSAWATIGLSASLEQYQRVQSSEKSKYE